MLAGACLFLARKSRRQGCPRYSSVRLRQTKRQRLTALPFCKSRTVSHLEGEPAADLEGSRTARTELLAGQRSRNAEADRSRTGRIQIVGLAVHVGVVEEVENLSEDRHLIVLRMQLEGLCQADILREEVPA